MKESFLFRCSKRYDVKGKKYFSYPLKYYCTDIGLRNVRLNLRQQEETHIMENIIYNELITRGYSVDVGVVEVYKSDEMCISDTKVQGLLIPSERTDAGYRLYDDKALEKLRAILFLKELDIPLETIKDVVNGENCDYGAVLKSYRKNLVQKINRLQGLLGGIDGMNLDDGKISFEAFNASEAEWIAETLVNCGESYEMNKFTSVNN